MLVWPRLVLEDELQVNALINCIISVRLYIIAIGVDLGTTFSVVGINKNGKVIIIEDKHKHRIFPSVVSYLDNGGTYMVLR